MLDLIESIYNAGFGVWNTIVGLAMQLFTTSPTTAGGGSVYATAHNLFNAIRDISVPIAIIFFLIAIIRETTATPPDQQVRRFVGDAIKFGVIVGILFNLWTIMGIIIEVTDGITSSLAGTTNATGTSYELVLSETLHSSLDEALKWPLDWSLNTIWDNMKEIIIIVLGYVVALIASIVVVIITVSSSVSILSSAFQRIIKPLILLPFSCITVAMGAGTGDADRIMWSYIKTLIGLLLSGAFMAVCVIVGASLGNSMIVLNGVSGRMSTIILMSTQAAIIPIIIAGLVKGVDGMIGKFL